MKCSRLLKITKKVDYVDDEWKFEAEVDEDLGDYWTHISAIDRKQWFSKEVHLRHWFDIKVLDDY